MRRWTMVLVPAVLLTLSSGIGEAQTTTRTAPSITGAVRRVPPRPSAPVGVTVRAANIPQECSRDGRNDDDRYGRDGRYDRDHRYDRDGRYDRDDRYDRNDRYDSRGRTGQGHWNDRFETNRDGRYDRNGRYDGRGSAQSGTGRLETRPSGGGSITSSRVNQGSDRGRTSGCGYYDTRGSLDRRNR